MAEAYETALRGDIHGPHSPASRAAREKLRNVLAPVLDSYWETAGDAMQLHYTCPTAKPSAPVA